MKSKVYKLDGKMFRYNFDRNTVEYVAKAGNEELKDEAEWMQKYGEPLFGIDHDGYMVIDSIGLSRENWENREARDSYLHGWAQDLGEESSRLAAEELMEKYPQRKIFTVDTLCASMGQGLLVYLAARKRQGGASIEEVRDWTETRKLSICHQFTVDDLHFLKRGGRISGATALMGTMLNIKPVLHVDDTGRLVNIGKARGRQGARKALMDKMEQTAIDPHSQTVFISHGDCPEDAQTLAQMVRERFGVREIVINYIGPVIGAHSGPGTLALFYIGTER